MKITPQFLIYTSAGDGLQVIAPIDQTAGLSFAELRDGMAALSKWTEGTIARPPRQIKERFSDVADSLVAAGLAVRLGSAPEPAPQVRDISKLAGLHMIAPVLEVPEPEPGPGMVEQMQSNRIAALRQTIAGMDGELTRFREMLTACNSARHLMMISGDRDLLELGNHPDLAHVFHALVVLCIGRHHLLKEAGETVARNGVSLKEAQEALARNSERLNALETVVAKLRTRDVGAAQILRQLVGGLEGIQVMMGPQQAIGSPLSEEDLQTIMSWLASTLETIQDFLAQLPLTTEGENGQ
jgi:hypothetical protein